MYNEPSDTPSTFVTVLATIFVMWVLNGVINTFTKPEKSEKTEERVFITSQTGRKYFVDIIDGCEYIRDKWRGDILTHKGNCTNSVHTIGN